MGYQVPLFLFLFIAEGLVFALGVSFMLHGMSVLRTLTPAGDGLTRAAHLSISWMLINWWPHGSLHMYAGVDATRLLVIEYGFDITMSDGDIQIMRCYEGLEAAEIAISGGAVRLTA